MVKIFIITEPQGDYHTRNIIIRAFESEGSTHDYLSHYNEKVMQHNKKVPIWDQKELRDYEECELDDDWRRNE